MRNRIRVLAAAAGLTGYVFLAVQVLRSAQGADAWPVGSSARALATLAEQRMERGVAVLGGQEGSAASRLAAYRSDLGAAERDLVRSLEAMPAQPRTLARLAAVRSELSFGAPSGEQSSLAMISLAARLAPEAPAIQEQMGRLLLRLGDRDAAGACLRKAVALDPARAGGIVQAMNEQFYAPEEVLEALPRCPETLLALQRPFQDAGRIAEYAELLEGNLPGTVELLRAYARARLWGKEGERLVAAMERLGTLEDARLEAERLVELSRGRDVQGDPAGALAAAQRAVVIAPEDPLVLENLGLISLRAEDPASALEAFRDALGKLARRGRSVADRARLYRMIGVAEERHGARDRAYDAYKRALELDPEEPLALRRVTEMEKAAGLPDAEAR